MALIMLVDDDDQFREMLQAMVERLGHSVVTARNGHDALARHAQQPPDLVITDLIMPDMEGLELIRALHQFDPDLRIVAMSGGGRTNPAIYLRMAGSLGAGALLAKPFTFGDLTIAIESALSKTA